MSARDLVKDLLNALRGLTEAAEKINRQGGQSFLMGAADHARDVLAKVEAAGITAEPGACKGVMGGKITIAHLMIDRGNGEYCARCGMTPEQISAARSAGIEPLALPVEGKVRT